MKNFYSHKTVGTTMFNLNYTYVFHKDYCEIAFKLKKGSGVVNVFLSDNNQLSLFCQWGDFFNLIFNHKDVHKLYAMLRKPCPYTISILEQEKDYNLVSIGPNSLQMETGIERIIEMPSGSNLYHSFTDDSVRKAASELLNVSLKMWNELYDHCPFPGWKIKLEDIL